MTVIRRDRVNAEYVQVPAGAGLEAFWIMRTPVTNAQYAAAVASGVCAPPRHTTAYANTAKAHHPVVWVSRAQARRYAAWVDGRLPRDAEWTWVAQGSDGRRWPWGNTPPDAARANCRPHGPGTTTAVDAHPQGANHHAVLDLAGNVWEWVDRDDGGDQPLLVRGGGFIADADQITCGARIDGVPVGAFFDIGFRVIASGH